MSRPNSFGQCGYLSWPLIPRVKQDCRGGTTVAARSGRLVLLAICPYHFREWSVDREGKRFLPQTRPVLDPRIHEPRHYLERTRVSAARGGMLKKSRWCAKMRTICFSV